MGFVWMSAALVALYLLGRALGFGEHVSALSGTGPIDVGDRLKGLAYVMSHTMLVVFVPVFMIAAVLLACAGAFLGRRAPAERRPTEGAP
jgi:hypothetical protein